MEQFPWRLSIDFGTSNTAAAVVQGNGGVFVLRLGSRSDAIPSCVAVYNGEILMGEAAQQIAGIYPSAFEPTPKRRLGEEAVVLAGTTYDPAELVAAVLRYVLLQATRFVGGGSPTEVVLTHPDAWDDYMKGRLATAARMAGIEEYALTLMPEPVAAGWHYAAGSDVGAGAHVAVLDFGGGTCDASVLHLAQTPTGPVFHVVASRGIDPLGGHDFDAQLENWVYGQLAAEGKADLLAGLGSERAAADRAILRDQVREAKHALSFHGSAPIGVRSGGHEWVCTVTRGEFEGLIDSQVRQAVELVHGVIRQAVPSVQQLHKVYLTGGSSYIPALQAKLAEILPLKLGLMGDPKQITSIGALQAPARPRRAVPAPVAIPAPGLDRPHSGQTLPAPPLRAPAGDYGTPGAPPPGVPQDVRPPSKFPKKLLIGAGSGVTVLLVVATIALASARQPPGGPTSTGPSSSASVSTAPEPRLCGGGQRDELSDGECTLLTDAANLGLVDSDTCEANSDLVAANHGLICDPRSDSGFTPAEKPTIFVYGYEEAEAMHTEFDRIIDQFGAAERSVTIPPGWQDWTISDDPAKKIQGRILGAAQDGTNYLVWTEDDALMEFWAISEDADVEKLHDWWQK